MGKTAVLTGASGGVGWGVARGLLAAGWRVVALGRDVERLRSMHEGVDAVHCDMSSLTSVRKAAATLLEACPRIDALIGCAGVAPWRRRESQAGVELTWATNILGHALLAELLIPRVKQSAPSRIVMISGNAHRRATMHWDDLELRRSYSVMKAGSQAALAKVLWTYAMARELEGTGVTVNTFCPAFVQSGLLRDFPSWTKPLTGLAMRFAQTPDEGARTPLWLTTDESLTKMSGRFCRHEKVQPHAPRAQVQADQDHLLRVVRQAISV
ncbi:MAG: SDR family NAD(P)-dependent oxidoreductase [Polyangiales bacterium]